MKKSILLALIVAATSGSCTSDESVSGSSANKENMIPIAFSVQKQNITRAAGLETVGHYNFGVWTYKVRESSNGPDALVMDNYLVGYSDGQSKGYDKSKSATYSDAAGLNEYSHLSPWFYDMLGTDEYTYEGNDGFYKKSDAAFMSNNTNQYVRYWDLAYLKTNFYCYSPYNKNVTFTKGTTTSTINLPTTGGVRDGYDETLNSDYAGYGRTLSEYMYAGVQATNAAMADVTVPFKHMGAQLFIRFYEDIPGYKVEIVDLSADNGSMASGLSDDMKLGIQATPAIKPASGDTYTKGKYYTTNGGNVSFAEATCTASFNPSWDGCTQVETPLMFKLPNTNLTDYAGLGTTVHKIIQEKVTDGVQSYSYSPTIYYPVAQPTTTTTGFTFHVTYRIIAEDNKEVITVHNATVFVPVAGTANVDGTDQASVYITAWQPNTKYTYTFRISRNSSGSTSPSKTIDPTDPSPIVDKALFPIVFHSATIEDFTENISEYVVSE